MERWRALCQEQNCLAGWWGKYCARTRRILETTEIKTALDHLTGYAYQRFSDILSSSKTYGFRPGVPEPASLWGPERGHGYN